MSMDPLSDVFDVGDNMISQTYQNPSKFGVIRSILSRSINIKIVVVIVNKMVEGASVTRSRELQTWPVHPSTFSKPHT
jgi:hypothetical protein